MWNFARATAVVLSALFVLGAPAVAQPASDADATPGLTTADLGTRAGRVRVYLPDDMRPGDMISGTVALVPAGRSEEQRQRNLDQLNGVVVEIEGSRARHAGNAFSFVVPAAGALSVVLLSPDRRPAVARARIDAVPTTPTAPASQLPLLGQPGRPLSIPGPFDGDFANTSVRVGGAPAQFVAESPRGVVIRVPDGAAGPAPLEVSEGESRREGPFNRVVVSLSAPRLALLRGERTTLSVRVEGLPPPTTSEGLVPLRLFGSPTISLDQGNVQTVMLRPDAQGHVAFQREVTARAPGAFQIRARIVTAGEPR